MKKPSTAGSNGKPATASTVSTLALDVPHVVSFLADTTWDDKSPREPGTLLLVASEGLWKAWINDKACQRTAWVSAETLEALLESLNEKFGCDDFEWRRVKPQGRK